MLYIIEIQCDIIVNVDIVKIGSKNDIKLDGIGNDI